MKGHFKTALGQVTVILDDVTVGVAAAATSTTAAVPIKVGDLVTVTAANGTTPAAVAIASTKAAATHIVALSDMTLEGHINIKNTRADEIYSDVVAATAVGETKKVGLYKIIDADDVITA